MKKMNKNDSDIIIQFRNISKKFGKFYAVKNVNLEVRRGEIVGFLGPNGAGKSTTMKMLAFLLKPNEGEVWIRGNGELLKLTRGNKDHLLDNVGFLIENPFFYGDLSPRTILKYFAKLKGYPRSEIKKRVEDVVAMFGLSDWIDTKIKKFSKGMRQKIGIASAIIHDPDIIVLDEPQTGLDPKARKEVREFIMELKNSGKTIFLSSHLLYEISNVADKIAIINHGEIIAFDTLDNLELSAQKSIINVELLKTPDNIREVLNNMKDVIQPLTGTSTEGGWIKYNEDNDIFQIGFNGNPQNQLQILKALIAKGYEIIEYSVPKAGLLEDLFIDLTSQEEE